MRISKILGSTVLVTSLLAATPQISAGQTPDSTSGFNEYRANVSQPEDAQVVLIGEQHGVNMDGLGQLIARHTEDSTQILHEQPPGSRLDSLDFRNPQGSKELFGSLIMQESKKWQPVYSKDKEAFTMYGIDAPYTEAVQHNIADLLIATVANDYVDHGCNQLHSVEERTLANAYRPRKPDEALETYTEDAYHDIKDERDSLKVERQATMEDQMMQYVSDGDPTVVITGRGHIDGQTGSSLTDTLEATNTPYYSMVQKEQDQSDGFDEKQRRQLWNGIITPRIRELGFTPTVYRERYQTAYKLGDTDSSSVCHIQE